MESSREEIEHERDVTELLRERLRVAGVEEFFGVK